jgi:trigger factor
MIISRENTSELTATLKLHFTEEDYKDDVEKTLKDYQRKANMPGFRPGKVPAGMIHKMYGKAIIAEQIDKLLSESIAKYLEENKINLLGNPLPNEELNKTLDLDNQKEFDFFFDLGLSPEIEVDLNDKIEVNEYDISIEDKDIDKYLADLRKKYGKYINPEVSEENDMISGEFEELDANGNTVADGKKNTASVFMEHIPDEATKKMFIGIKTGDSLVVEPKKVAKNDFEISYLIGVKKEEVENIASTFRFTVKSVGRIEPAELNEEFYSKIYQNSNITTEEGLRDKIREDAIETYKKDAERQFINEVQKALVKNSSITLPDAFLKRYFFETSKDEKLTREQIEADYDKSSDALRWQLIENTIIKKYEIKVTQEDAKEFVKGYFRNTMGQKHEHVHDENCNHEHDHEQDIQTDEQTEQRLEEISSTVLKNPEESKKIFENLFDQRLLELYREKLKISRKNVTYEDFVKELSKQ